jgi:osmotically-inducible protein OsmY
MRHEAILAHGGEQEPAIGICAMASVLDQVRAALQSEPRLDLQRFPVALSYAEGTLTLEGEVGDIAAKKLALERAAAVPGVAGIVDRLRVQPAQPMGDGAIRDHLRDAWLQEPAFADFAIRVRVADRVESIREPAAARGALELEVADGVVTLNGQVPGLDDKRLAGVLAWWVPGSRDVINGIAVEPPEEDSDAAILEAVRLVLEKDPFVDATQIRAGVKSALVRLTGSVPSAAERAMAEADAWYVFGVDKVDNRIEIHRTGSSR